MQFTVILKLKEIAMAKVAVLAWTQYEVKSIWREVERRKEWNELEEEIETRFKEVGVASDLQDEMKAVSKRIGLQIRQLVKREHRQWSVLLDHRHWTSYGTVDAIKLADHLVGEESAGLPYCFYIACAYCFEKKVNYLWQKMSKGERDNIRRRVCPRERLVLFWIHYILGENQLLEEMACEDRQKFQSIFEYGYHLAAQQHYLVAMRYFIDRIPPDMKNDQLIYKLTVQLADHVWRERLPQESGNRMLCYLFTQMKEDVLIDVINFCPYRLLLHLIEWPYHYLLLPTAHVLWPRLSHKQFKSLLHCIHNSMTPNCNAYREVLRQFYDDSPTSFKEYIFKHDKSFIPKLSDVGVACNLF